MCWEIHGGGQAYIDCKVDEVVVHPPETPIKTCDDVLEEYGRTDNVLLKLKLLRTLVALDCIRPEQIVIQIELRR
jgi:hypothetical protein